MMPAAMNKEALKVFVEMEQSQLLAALQRVAHMMESPVQARIVLQAPEVEDVVVQPAPVSADDLRPGEH